ncbi:hypothetical protein B0I31_10249 [Saccharothrix carnea]|uniref:Uncharacterized protein n=1 Tax=Saccharothrix carnea TaxID=1280637 RepID=A0A2P8IF39_SACCR|nr:hypothetical protein B0I31_10249 [Saccharothrix carnea]
MVLIERLRRDRKWSGRRIAVELAAEGTVVSVRTVGRHLADLGLNRRSFLDPTGQGRDQREQEHDRDLDHQEQQHAPESRPELVVAEGGDVVA